MSTPEEPRLAPSWGNRVHLVLLIGIMIGAIVHQAVFWYWYIEDSAISFAYARHLAAGEGLVTYPGGERVEGYSNPLWVLLMAVFELVGVDGFTSSKLLAMVFGTACIPLVWATVRRVRPGGDVTPLLAAALLAGNSQFAIWNASGLENSLFCFLITLGMYRVVVEGEEGGFPWSALAFFGLSITRPEAIVYAAFAGFWAMVLTLRSGKGLGYTLRWLLVFWIPFGVYQAARIAYFGWEFPNTYYAKLGRRHPALYGWNLRCWKYLRDYTAELWQGWFLPVYAAGLLGLRGLRTGAVLTASLALAVVLLLPGIPPLNELSWWPQLDMPDGWITVRVWTLIVLLVGLPVLALGRSGWKVLVLAWGLCAVGLFFTVYSTGDWMRGYRWLNLIAAPASVLAAMGIAEVADLAQRLFGRFTRGHRIAWGALSLTLATLMLIPQISYSEGYTRQRATTPFAVRNRTELLLKVQDRLMLDRAVLLDGDMGGTMFWNPGNQREILDYCGLVDVPYGHHTDGFPRKFSAEYIHHEKRPDLMHHMGAWAKTTGLLTMPEYKQNYIELTGWATGRRAAKGSGFHLRRDHVWDEKWKGPNRRSVIYPEGGPKLIGIEANPRAGQGDALYLELGMKPGETPFRVVAFLTDGEDVTISWDVAPAYDWAPYDMWRGEIAHGRYELNLTPNVRPGRYDFGIVAFDDQGRVLVPEEVNAGFAPDEARPPVFARGEARFPGLVTVVDPTEIDDLVGKRRTELTEAAAVGDCETAEERWDRMRRLLAGRRADLEPFRPDAAYELAECWARYAGDIEDVHDRVEVLERAWNWDHNAPSVAAYGDPVADALYAEGLAAREAEDWEAAYTLFDSVLRVDRSRAWARRYAEDARDHRLLLNDYKPERIVAHPRVPGLRGGPDEEEEVIAPDGPDEED